MRGTIHLVTADDAATLRPLTQVVLTRAIFGQAFGKNLAGLDLEPVLESARAWALERPRTRAEMGRLLADRWPGWDATSLGHAFTYLVPLIQVPPRGIWGRTGFRGPSGAELLDLPDAPLPDPDTPAPPVFLPEYDNVMFSYADRNRVNPDQHQIPLAPGNGGRFGTILIGGTYQGDWQIRESNGVATLLIKPHATIPDSEAQALAAEGRRLLAFAADSAGSDDSPNSSEAAEATAYAVRFLEPRTGTTSSGLR
jgi:hypothetical protein